MLCVFVLNKNVFIWFCNSFFFFVVVVIKWIWDIYIFVVVFLNFYFKVSFWKYISVKFLLYILFVYRWNSICSIWVCLFCIGNGCIFYCEIFFCLRGILYLYCLFVYVSRFFNNLMNWRDVFFFFFVMKVLVIVDFFIVVR